MFAKTITLGIFLWHRTMPGDRQWLKLKHIVKEINVYDKPNLRQTLEGMLYRIRVGCPWRDIPSVFGKWYVIYQLFRYWRYTLKWQGLFERLKIRQCIADNQAIPVIPVKSNSTKYNQHTDWCLYKYRHLVENAFARLKQFRGIATRYDKLKVSYESAVLLACSYIWLKLTLNPKQNLESTKC